MSPEPTDLPDLYVGEGDPAEVAAIIFRAGLSDESIEFLFQPVDYGSLLCRVVGPDALEKLLTDYLLQDGILKLVIQDPNIRASLQHGRVSIWREQVYRYLKALRLKGPLCHD